MELAPAVTEGRDARSEDFDENVIGRQAADRIGDVTCQLARILGDR